MKFCRIYIMGPPGSGKTVFAIKLTEKTGLPNFDLDDITYREHGYKKISPKERNKKLRDIIKNHKEWVIVGSYAHSWIEPALKTADVVIILNKKRRVVITRLIMRYLKRKLGFDKAKKGAGKVSELVKLIGYALTYKADYFMKHNALADKHKKQKIVITNQVEKERLLKKIVTR